MKKLRNRFLIGRSEQWSVAATWVIVVIFGSMAAPVRAAPNCTLYDPDPRHLWNRLHQALMVRIGPDGQAYGDDRIEPLLWRDSNYLLHGKQAEQITAVVDEFIVADGAGQITAPVKRAVLQRDLWLIANWLIMHGQQQPSATVLLAKLTRIMKQLALTTEQIDHLPHNDANAVADGTQAEQFDPQTPRRSFLPPDLLRPDGPWICVARTDGPSAPAHLNLPHHLVLHPDNPFTNSVFIVLLKTPAGRSAAEKYVRTLARQPRPMFVTETIEDVRRIGRANRDLPTLPLGSVLVLLRQMMLINSAGELVASPIVESVQLRVTTTAMVIEHDHGGLDEDPNHVGVFEFELRRAGLFADGSGLIDVSSLSHEITTGLTAPRADIFEIDPKNPMSRRFRMDDRPRRVHCFGCHAVSSIYGVRSFHRGSAPDETAPSPSSFPIAVQNLGTIRQRTIEWKSKQPVWQALQQYWNQP